MKNRRLVTQKVFEAEGYGGGRGDIGRRDEAELPQVYRFTFHVRNRAVKQHCMYEDKSALIELAGFIQQDPWLLPIANREDGGISNESIDPPGRACTARFDLAFLAQWNCQMVRMLNDQAQVEGFK